jgi:uncharacterized protein
MSLVWRDHAMRRNQAVRLLRAHAHVIKAMGANVAVSGSARPSGATPARGAISTCSSITTRTATFQQSNWCALKNYISEALEIEVDVTTRDGLHPLIRDQVVAKAEQVF